jgi:hypothetical protein
MGKILGSHHASAYSLKILLVHSIQEGVLHMKHVYDGFLFLDGGHSKFSCTLIHGTDQSG